MSVNNNLKISFCERVNGKAVFIKRPFKKDEIIHKLSGQKLYAPTKFSIEIDNNMHILDKYGCWINHSCNPSTKIENQSVIALRDLEVGEELTFDYNENESVCVAPFTDIDTGIVIKGNKLKE